MARRAFGRRRTDALRAPIDIDQCDRAPFNDNSATSHHQPRRIRVSLTMDMLQREHRTMSRLLDLLERQITLFEKTEHPDYELISEITDYFRSFPDLYHHPKEELVLERLRERNPQAAAAVGDLEADHDGCAKHLDSFARNVVKVLLDAELPRDAFVRVARDFIDNERRHMKGEEQVFFPAAEENLTEADWLEIDARVAKFRDPLAATEMPHRFELIRKQIH